MNKAIGIAVLLIITSFFSCTKKSDNSSSSTNPKVPLLNTDTVNVSVTTATCSALVTSEGSSPVITRGICWSTSSNPTTYDAHLSAGSGTGSFNVTLEGLSAKTLYYARAYAMNSEGTGYGNQVKFTTLATTGTITGTAHFVTGETGDLAGSKVSIYLGVTEWMNDLFLVRLNVTGSGNTVTYTIPDIDPGTYILDIWKDNDLDGTWTPGDFIGWYGTGNQGNPSLSQIHISPGSSPVCDVTMYTFK